MHPLTAYRTKAGMTQAQLAEAAGVRQSTISHIETGARVPDRETAAKIEAATGGAVTRLELLYPDEPAPSPPDAPAEQGAAA